jgi:anti-anti-sigma factor
MAELSGRRLPAAARRFRAPIDPPSRRPGFHAAAAGDGLVHVTISGELDVTTTRTLARQLAGIPDLKPTRLVIDLSAVSYLDCAAARLLAAANTVLPPGQRLVLTGLQPPVRRLLELIGLTELIEMRD